MEAIKIENLSFKYSNSERFTLENVNLSVTEGEILTIFGKSGSGKSTLVEMLVKSIRPIGELSGKIEIFNKNIDNFDDLDFVKKVGFVSQSPENQIITDKVWSELAFGLENINVSIYEIDIRIAEISNYFGINSWINKDTADLSGGQKQLLNLAAVMCLQPEILIFDEPLSQLDPIACQQFVNIIKKINSDFGTTIVIVEHNLDLLVEVSDKFCLLKSGKVEFVGSFEKSSCDMYSKSDDNVLLLPFNVRISKEILGDYNCRIDSDLLKNSLKSKSTLHEGVKYNKYIEMSKKTPILALDEVCFRYEQESINILNNLSIKIYKNEILSIIGANGSGKSTFLKLLAGIIKENVGKTKLSDDVKIGYLPQNPQNLFSCDTVIDEIIEFSSSISQIKLDEIIEICNLSEILNQHPYDISGGEQQKVAFAKILMTNPDFILLDEPTKGMDSIFKEEFIRILRQIKENGATIVIVTHDLDFSAEVSDKCALFFDGKIVSCLETNEFYTKNSYYTTTTRKFVKQFIDNVVTFDQLKEYFGIKKLLYKDEFSSKNTSATKKEEKILEIKPKSSAINIYLLISIFILMPLTIFIGYKFFDDRKYYFISILLIIETFLPFMIDLEKRENNSKEIAIISSFCSLTVSSRAVFFMIPQFKPMLALVAISGVSFGSQVGFVIGAISMFLSNFIFGQGPWTPWQVFAMGLIGAVFGIFKNGKQPNKFFLALFGALSAILIYGVLMNISTVLISQVNPTIDMIKTSIIIGFPMDLVHAFATFLFILFGSEFIIKKINHIKLKYDVFND